MPFNSTRPRVLIFALVFLSLLPRYIVSGQQPAKAFSSPTRPRLVLLIVADQFRYDYLERFGDLFVEKGLKRLLREGGSWVDANYDHMPTYTAPGHATMLTGAYPAVTGIIGNEWPDRETGNTVSSITDETVSILGGSATEKGVSPRRLLASTLGDELRLVSNDRAKVIGISFKDRAAVLMSGRHANAAYWFSSETGLMVSSDYYFRQLPDWVKRFNEQRPTEKYFKAKWERLLPEPTYLKYAGEDSPPWENIGKVAGETNAFPHIISGGATTPGPSFYSAVGFSPFANEITFDFTKLAMENEKLGEDEFTDILAVSFDSNDYIGHRYGPYSQEVMDITLRFDRQVAELLDFVDAKVGLNNTIVIFTSDHGVAPGPAQGIMTRLASGGIDNAALLKTVRAAISAHFNKQGKSPDPTADYIYKMNDDGKSVDAFINNNLYFNLEALKRDGISLEEIERVVGEAALTVPGVVRYFTRTDLMRGLGAASAESSVDPFLRRAQHGFYPRRSGNVILVIDPFKYPTGAVTATHGSPYTYDTHVPLVIRAIGISPGRYLEPASPADIAPTLAALLRVQAPSSVTGRILIEAFVPKH